LLNLRLLPGALLLTALTILPIAGCRAQAPSGAPLTPQQDRRIAVLVRSQLNVPPDWEIVPGKRSASEIPGYDSLDVEFYPASDPAHRQPVEFLISKDGNTLARLAKYDLKTVPGMDIPTEGRPVRGDKAAKVEVVNFDDLECPYCARMHAELFPATLDHYKGLIKIVYKDDPLVQIHPWAMHAAVDADCLAAMNGDAYWSYVDYLHTHGEDITGPDRDAAKSNTMLDKLAKEEGAREHLDAPKLAACVAKQDEAVVQASMKEADSLKIEGTPALFVDGERIDGAQPIPYLWAAIDRALRAQGITPPPEPPASPAAAASPNGAAQ
jgi:protein-disulfide isomerase